MRVRLRLEFDGSPFGGWQLQSDEREITHPSIQGVLERAISKIFRSPERIGVTGCGRTDAGVHAEEYFAHFDWPADSVINSEEIEKFRHRVNCILPPQVVLTKCEQADDFHAQEQLSRKTYEYRILIRRAKPTLHGGRCWWLPLRAGHSEDFDVSLLKMALKLIEGERDFRAFMAAHSSVKTTVRTIFRASCVEEWLGADETLGAAPLRGLLLKVQFEGNGFLRHMVRNLIGAVVEVSTRQRDLDSLAHLLGLGAQGVPDRSQAGFCAPPEGLFLVKLTYK